MSGPPKRPLEGGEASSAGSDAHPPLKQLKTIDDIEEDDFDTLLGRGDSVLAELGIDLAPPAEVPGEKERREFSERLSRIERMDEPQLAEFLAAVRDAAPRWGEARRWRSTALLLMHVARAPRTTRAVFAAESMPLLGAVLKEGVATLEESEYGQKAGVNKQEASMWVLACLTCLSRLPIGRATMWEHRFSVGKAFDRLHRWCGRERSAIAAELRSPTSALCKRWKKQPKPASQSGTPVEKALRVKVVTLIMQGLNGIAGGNSPASPARPMTPASPAGGGQLAPPSVAAEVEAALFGLFGGATPEYRQHARMLRTNLALHGNAPLRARVLSGELDAGELVKLSSEELAPEALQELRHAQQAKILQERTLREKLVAPPPREQQHHQEDDDGPRVVGVLERVNTAGDIVGALERAEGSGDLQQDEGDAEAGMAPPPLPTPLRMEEPPTPFRSEAEPSPALGLATGASARDFLDIATPAPLEEDDEDASIIRWLSRPV